MASNLKRGPAWRSQALLLALAALAFLINLFHLLGTQGLKASLWVLGFTALACFALLRRYQRLDVRLRREGEAVGGFGAVASMRLGRLEAMSALVRERLDGAKLRRTFLMGNQLDGGIILSRGGLAWRPGLLSRKLLR